MSDNIDGKSKNQVAAVLSDERISDAQRTTQRSSRSVTTHRTLPSSHDEIFASSSKSAGDIRPFDKSNRRVTMITDRPSQPPSGIAVLGDRSSGTLEKTGSQQSVKSILRRSGGPIQLGGIQTVMELEERIAYKTGISIDDKKGNETVGPHNQVQLREPVPLSNAGALDDSMRDPNQKTDIVHTISKLTGIPAESLGKAAGSKKDTNGVYVLDDSDLEDQVGKLAVAVAITEDDEGVFIPAAVQYDPDAKPSIVRNRRFRLYGFLACTVLLLAVIGLAVLLTQRNKETPQDVGMDSTIEDEAIESARSDANGIIEQLERIVGSEVLADVEGAHFRAKEWLLNEDPMQLTRQDSNLIQRYLLAVVYFKLHEEGDWLSCNAPSEEEPDDFCLYQNLVSIFPTEYQSVPWFRWLSGEHECYWAGLVCDDLLNIRSIDLAGQEISGTLPMELAYLDYLQEIGLAWNSIRGTIPSEYGKMRHLLTFVLHYNQLSGSIPTGWSRFMTLQLFNVAANSLTGSIPEDFFSVSSLKGLFLYDNMLTGTFPSELSQMSLLTYIRMDHNLFTGTLPSEIGLLSPRELWLYQLPLTGPIPSEIGNMKEISDLRLSRTGLTGQIPDELWNLTGLKHLDLFNTLLSGSISPNVSRLTDLVSIRLHNSTLTGTIPEALADLSNLKTVRLNGNKFVGEVPYGFCAHEQIQELAADCLQSGDAGDPLVTCSCCDICCDHESGHCDQQE